MTQQEQNNNIAAETERFMIPVRTGELLAEGTVVHMGRSTAVIEATVFNIVHGEQRAISKVLGTFSFAHPKSHE